MAEHVFWLNNTFQFKKRVHTAADRNWKTQNNSSLLYSTNSLPTAVVSFVHAWMLNTELETVGNLQKTIFRSLNSKYAYAPNSETTL